MHELDTFGSDVKAACAATSAHAGSTAYAGRQAGEEEASAPSRDRLVDVTATDGNCLTSRPIYYIGGRVRTATTDSAGPPKSSLPTLQALLRI